MLTKAQLLSFTGLTPPDPEADNVLMMDIETYQNFFCISFYCPRRDIVKSFYLTPDSGELPYDRIYAIMKKNTIVTFNGANYDIPMLYYALTGANNQQLMDASNYIITKRVMPWIFAREKGFRIPDIDHIDIIEVAPGMVGLKLYGARAMCPKLQELPYPVGATLTEEQMQNILAYNVNDLHVTYALYLSLIEQIRLREQMQPMAGVDQWGRKVDLRSKKDAQIASAVLRYQMEQRDGVAPQKPTDITPGMRFKYDAPDMLVYETPEMQQVLADVLASDFEVPPEGKKLMLPKALEGRDVRIGGGVYRMGIGGLHSQEESVAHIADEETMIVDRDFESFYPNMMLNFRWCPRHLGDSFFDVFSGIVATRLKAKANKEMVVANSLKIVVNSSFGLTGSKYSFLYDPKVMIQVTLTGQLILLYMIERAHLAGIRVVSANTDGVVVKIHPDQYETWNAIIAEVEEKTRIKTEETRYSALYSRDVNNYIAVKTDGKVKLKGAYSQTGVQKNPMFEICNKAVVEYITNGTPLEDTISACEDIRQFVGVRTVKGGAIYRDDGDYLGKVVRWYFAEGSDGFIRTVDTDDRTGNWKTVAKTSGCKPLMDLPEGFPDDVDIDRYVQEAREILMDINCVRRPDPIKPIRLYKWSAPLFWALAV